MIWQDFVNQLQNNAVIELNSTLTVPVGQFIYINQTNVRIVGNGTIVADCPNYALVHSGTKLVIDGIDLWNLSGGGINANQSLRLNLRRMQINTAAQAGINLQLGAGAWFNDVHLNGTKNTNSIGLRAAQWDTLFSHGCLTEEHDTSIRLGMDDGNSANFFIPDWCGDRCRTGVILEPTGMISNLKVGVLWVAGQDQGNGPGTYPLQAHNMEGAINGCVIQHLHASDFLNKQCAIWGNFDLRILDQRHY